MFAGIPCLFAIGFLYKKPAGMNLNLRKVVHPQAHENYRVVLKLDGDEFEIGSIGIRHGAAWR
jgi:hypothetical protein